MDFGLFIAAIMLIFYLEPHDPEGDSMQYRKIPVVINAEGPITEERLIQTLEGTMRASVGDYVITGVNGEVYPCKPDIFAKTYEAVS